MHFVDLSPKAFVTLPDEGRITMGLNVETLSDFISKADPEDVITLAYNPETRQLRVEYGSVQANMALIDPEMIRQEPDVPDLEWANEATIATAELANAVDMADLVADMASFVCDEETQGVDVVAEGDVDDVTYVLREVDEVDVNATTRCTYSMDYLNILVDALKGPEVRVSLDDEFPAFFQYEYAEGAADVETLVAPRIQS